MTYVLENLNIKDADGTSIPRTTIEDSVSNEVIPIFTLPYGDIQANWWTYAAASGGILNTTTAVTIRGASVDLRNYVKSLQISSEALGTATEVAIRDGAGGTVLWRMKIGTAGLLGGRDIVFDPPLKGSVNTLLEVVTLTASTTGAVYVNAQGYFA